MPKNKTKQLIIILPEEKHITFKGIAASKGTFMQTIIEHFIDGYIEKNTKKTKKKK